MQVKNNQELESKLFLNICPKCIILHIWKTLPLGNNFHALLSCQTINHDIKTLSDPIYIDFGRLPSWNCPVDDGTESHDVSENVKPAMTNYKEDHKFNSLNNLDDLESEPSINLRRKYKGKYQFCNILSAWCEKIIWLEVCY